jgi:putative transposase
LSSYAQNHIHLIFSTKGRLKIISKNIKPRLWAYIAAICKNNAMAAFAVGGMGDHVHVLFRLPPALSLIRAVGALVSNYSITQLPNYSIPRCRALRGSPSFPTFTPTYGRG